MTKIQKSWLIAVILLLLVIVTGAIVINIALPMTANPTADKTISLTANSPIYDINQAGASEESSTLPQASIISSASNEQSGLTIANSNQIWTTNTTVNIFEHNDFHVSTDGTGSANHIIAPGTENNYTFSLNNDKEYAIKYNIDISGTNDSEYEIPVMVQILDAEGNSLSGDMKPIKALNSVSSSGTINPYSNTQYQINWKWDFENDTDDYDTFLGNKAVEEEIACHININVISEYDYDYSSDTPSNDSPVKTGDSRNLVLYIFILVSSLIILTLAFVLRKKHNGDSRK